MVFKNIGFGARLSWIITFLDLPLLSYVNLSNLHDLLALYFFIFKGNNSCKVLSTMFVPY